MIAGRRHITAPEAGNDVTNAQAALITAAGFICLSFRVVALEADVSAVGILPRSPAGQLVAIDAERITHFVWQRGDVSACPQRILNQLPTNYPQRFALAYGNHTFRVYRVLSGPGGGTAFERIDWNRATRWCGDEALQRGPIQ